MTQLQAKILGKPFDYTSGEPVALIEIGKMNFKTGVPSVLPNVVGADLYGTMVHELGHALGISGTAIFDKDTNQAKFEDIPSIFDKGLIDNRGRKISETTGIISYIDNDRNTIGNPNTDFDASGNVYFTGKNVAEVLKDSSLKGVPINVRLEGDTPIPELSHLEMDRGLMSHQPYSNLEVSYTNLPWPLNPLKNHPSAHLEFDNTVILFLCLLSDNPSNRPHIWSCFVYKYFVCQHTIRR